MKTHESTSRRFHLLRKEDVSGVSGTGVVAEGCEYSNGMIALVFISQYPCVNIYPNIKIVEAVHGHSGASEVIWDD